MDLFDSELYQYWGMLKSTFAEVNTSSSAVCIYLQMLGVGGLVLQCVPVSWGCAEDCIRPIQWRSQSCYSSFDQSQPAERTIRKLWKIWRWQWNVFWWIWQVCLLLLAFYVCDFLTFFTIMKWFVLAFIQLIPDWHCICRCVVYVSKNISCVLIHF